MNKEKNKIPLAKLALYTKLVEANSQVEQKGATMPYTAVNGNMFSFLNEDGLLALRLPEKEREEFMSEYNTSLMEAHGIVMKEYVLVPEELFKNTKKVKKYFDLSYNYAKSLKAKTSKKTKSIKKKNK